MSSRSDTAVAATLGLLGTATLAVPVWLWARTDGLIGSFRHLPNLNAGDANLVGFVAIDLMLLQVLLLARLPWLERAWGRDVLTRRHRRLGYWSFWLMLLHVYLFALQRATRDPGNAGRALWRVFVTDRHMLLATIGTLLLVMVVVTSTYRARNRLRYETWHWLHLYAYVGAGLVLPHILIGADLAVGWVAAFWWTFYGVAVAAILVWRIGRPALVSRRHDLHVSAVRREVPGVVSVEVAGRDLDRLGVASGQFLTWRFRGSRGWTRGHPYSLSAAPTSDLLRVTVRGGGDGGDRLATVPVGARALVEGPYGRPGGHRRRHSRLLLLAAGVGVTPFRARLEDLP
ncbi:MAG: putative ferric reductase, partial [Nocardioidaceae bacterium]|nr:putative ferric reductase [Nocardioidaceae bacterium]